MLLPSILLKKKNIFLGERGPIGHPGLHGVKGEPGMAGSEGSTVRVLILYQHIMI